MKIIIGAGKTALDGWISTQETELNVLKKSDLEKNFSKEKTNRFSRRTCLGAYDF